MGGSYVPSIILDAKYRAKNETWSAALGDHCLRDGLVMAGDGENTRVTFINRFTKLHLTSGLRVRGIDILILLPF